MSERQRDCRHIIAYMDLDGIVQSLDQEIDRLQRVRALLSDQTTPLKVRNVSEESRARMAAAQTERRKREKAKK
jgi:hypothetical protein